MDAKDTVIQYAQNRRGKYYFQLGNLFDAKVIAVGSLRALLEKQAELSFKAGMREVIEWINDPFNTCNEVDDLEQPTGMKMFNDSEWQSELKEWGIE